jgi:uncharacterized protein YbbK (DUF523 family)
MRQFVRPQVVISKCIEFDHCRYDGSLIPSDFVKALKPYVDFIPVCAETEIGLGVPRNSMRIVSVNGELRLIQPIIGLDVTEKMRTFSSQFLSSLPEVMDSYLSFAFPPAAGRTSRSTLAQTKRELYPRLQVSSEDLSSDHSSPCY